MHASWFLSSSWWVSYTKQVLNFFSPTKLNGKTKKKKKNLWQNEDKLAIMQ
jgi:hypothetical protein